MTVSIVSAVRGLRSRRAGRLYGTTAVAGNPDAPVARVVQIAHAPNAAGTLFPGAQLVGAVLSNASGAWSLSDLDPTLRYHAIAYDHTGVHDPVIKMNLVPSVD